MANQKTLNELLSELSEKIRIFIILNSTKALAEDSGVSQPVITSIRNGKKEGISLTTCIALANALGYNITDLKLEKGKIKNKKRIYNLEMN